MDSSRRWRVSPARFRWFALATFVAMIVIVLSGAAVRLTGSGLGCPDWPTCYHHQLVGSTHLHPLIEYTNRMITIALVVLTGVTLVAAWLRSPRRRDLLVLAGALVGGVFADAILGAFVVYSKLNPFLVAIHMWLSLAMVVLGALLYHHSKYLYGPDARADVRDPWMRRLAGLLWVPFVVLLATGTATTGSGPHAGNYSGQVIAKRLPFSFVNAAWVHSVAATLFIGLVVGLTLAVWRSGATRLRGGLQRLIVISLIQALIGLTQYLTHVPAWLVELHVAGAVSLTIGVTQFTVRQVARDRQPGTEKRT